MCVIACKPQGIAMPSKEIMENMFYANPDGAGFMYAQNGKVHIRKGYMTFSAFEKAIDALQEKFDCTAMALVMHFRIGTAGGNIPANTHPYPITDSIKLLQDLSVNSDLGVAHNGIINIVPRQKDINDTMEYIASQLAPLKRAVPEFYRNVDLMQLVQNGIKSRMAFLNGDGEIFTIGEFLQNNGILYSNNSYLPYEPLYNYSHYIRNYSYDDYWDVYGSSSWKKRNVKSKTDVKIVSRNMMALSGGEYVISDTGEWYSGDDNDMLIDENGDVYAYDYLADCATYFGGTPKTQDGKELLYDFSRASLEYVIPRNTPPITQPKPAFSPKKSKQGKRK